MDLQAGIPEFSPRDLATVIFKRRRAIVSCYAAILGVTLLYCFFWPPTYEAAVRILVKHDRLDPLVTADQRSLQTLSRPIVTDEDLNTEGAVVQSNSVLEATVRDLGLDRARTPWYLWLLSLPQNTIDSIYNFVHRKPNPTPFDRAVQGLRRRLIVLPQKRSAVIELRLRWGDPAFAARVLDRLSQNYLAQHLAVRSGPDTHAFFLAQAAEKKAELATIEQQIQRVRDGASSDVIDYERQLAIQQSADFEAEWRKAQAQEAQLEARVEGYSQELANTPSRVLTESRPSPALDELQQKIMQLELRRSELLQKYLPSARLVLDTEDELGKARNLLAVQESTLYSARTTALNPVASNIGRDLATDRAQLLSLGALSRANEQNMYAYRDQATGLKRDALVVERLERDRKAAEASYVEYIRRYEESRVEDEMNRDRLVNVAPIEPVRAGLSPVKPKSGLILKLALALGLFVSLGLAFLMEWSDHRLKSEQDVEVYLRMPVLATIERAGRVGMGTNGHR